MGSCAKLTVVQITDVYVLENFPHLKNLLLEKKNENPYTISMLTGDFLAPYLLSSIDKGYGMMKMLNEVPIDYVTWGNHEADIPHKTVCRHVKEYRGSWLNSNMQTHAAMGHQKPYEVIEVRSPDGSHTRKVGLVAVLSDEADLYKHFAAPGAFGGAKIECPWETLKKYKQLLEEEHGCDVVVPLQHLYVPQDHRTCHEFNFPVILSGHDHHQVDEVVNGTRLLKPGLDAKYATVLELSWDDPAHAGPPHVSAEFVRVADWPADEALSLQVLKAYSVLDPLRNTELHAVDDRFRPLSSFGARGRVCTMGRLICTLIREALNTDKDTNTNVDAVLLMGGNIRAGKDYPPDAFFSLEALRAEIKAEEVVGIVDMPGWLLAEGVKATHVGDPIPGWFQYGDGVEEDDACNVVQVAGAPIEPDRVYRVATKISDLTNGQSPPLAAYYSTRTELLPSHEILINIHALLMGFFARNLWRRIWETARASHDGVAPEGSPKKDSQDVLDAMDTNNDGVISVEEIQAYLATVGIHTDKGETALAELVREFADVTGDGAVTIEDLERFANDEGLLHEEEDAIEVRVKTPTTDASGHSGPTRTFESPPKRAS